MTNFRTPGAGDDSVSLNTTSVSSGSSSSPDSKKSLQPDYLDPLGALALLKRAGVLLPAVRTSLKEKVCWNLLILDKVNNS